MVRLTNDEKIWLINNYPSLEYNEDRGIINGLLPVDCKFNDVRIKDSFNIEVRLCLMSNRDQYPIVYNTDKRVLNIARKKNLPCADLHVDYNNQLCLGINERFNEYYPGRFDIQTFIKHLCEHFYWVAFYDRYDKEPWPSEAHGKSAILEFYIEIGDIENARKWYKNTFHKGISKQKLRHIMERQELKDTLLRRIRKNGRLN